jgi:hypothetical protein
MISCFAPFTGSRRKSVLAFPFGVSWERLNTHATIQIHNQRIAICRAGAVGPFVWSQARKFHSLRKFATYVFFFLLRGSKGLPMLAVPCLRLPTQAVAPGEALCVSVWPLWRSLFWFLRRGYWVRRRKSCTKPPPSCPLPEMMHPSLPFYASTATSKRSSLAIHEMAGAALVGTG